MRFSVWELLLILAIVLVLFGTKRLRNLGADLGASFKGFRDSMKEGEKSAEAEDEKKPDHITQGRVIDAEATRENTPKEKDKV
jgi:sec-independent protein translocase protein TatA